MKERNYNPTNVWITNKPSVGLTHLPPPFISLRSCACYYGQPKKYNNRQSGNCDCYIVVFESHNIGIPRKNDAACVSMLLLLILCGSHSSPGCSLQSVGGGVVRSEVNTFPISKALEGSRHMYTQSLFLGQREADAKVRDFAEKGKPPSGKNIVLLRNVYSLPKYGPRGSRGLVDDATSLEAKKWNPVATQEGERRRFEASWNAFSLHFISKIT